MIDELIDGLIMGDWGLGVQKRGEEFGAPTFGTGRGGVMYLYM